MLEAISSANGSLDFLAHNGTNSDQYEKLEELVYHKYVFFAVCSALLGLPSNILLLVILMRIGLFSRRQSALSRSSFLKTRTTGSFERFLFEVVFIDTLLIIYHFVDNFLSVIHEDRSTGQHFLIHVSDFCCKFFTYIAKMSVLLTTWLLLFLILNQLILTLDYNNETNRPNQRHTCWNRGLYYVNAKYSTVFLIFIFSIYNIYPIEVLKYQKKEDQIDYNKEGGPGVCSTNLEGKSTQLLNATNYGYYLLGVAIPCVVILVISIIIICRTCRNAKLNNNECTSLSYIAGTIGIVHALLNLPVRLTDLVLLFSSPYVSYFPYLISFNHEAQSLISLSYGYKCFICIIVSRRFRLHAKSVLCFLIENKYDDRHKTDRLTATNNWHQLSKMKQYKRHYHHQQQHTQQQQQQHDKHSQSNKTYISSTSIRKFPLSGINKYDIHRFTTSERTAWIRPYFTQYNKHHLQRPCGRSSSCHQINSKFSPSISSNIETSKKHCSRELNTLSSSVITDSSSSCIVSVPAPNGEYVYVPLPQKHTFKQQLSPSVKQRIDQSYKADAINLTIFSEHIEKLPVNRITLLSSSHVY